MLLALCRATADAPRARRIGQTHPIHRAHSTSRKGGDQRQRDAGDDQRAIDELCAPDVARRQVVEVRDLVREDRRRLIGVEQLEQRVAHRDRRPSATDGSATAFTNRDPWGPTRYTAGATVPRLPDDLVEPRRQLRTLERLARVRPEPDAWIPALPTRTARGDDCQRQRDDEPPTLRAHRVRRLAARCSAHKQSAIQNPKPPMTEASVCQRYAPNPHVSPSSRVRSGYAAAISSTNQQRNSPRRVAAAEHDHQRDGDRDRAHVDAAAVREQLG